MAAMISSDVGIPTCSGPMSTALDVNVAVRDLHDVPQARHAAEDAARSADMCALDVSIISLVASEMDDFSLAASLEGTTIKVHKCCAHNTP